MQGNSNCHLPGLSLPLCAQRARRPQIGQSRTLWNVPSACSYFPVETFQAYLVVYFPFSNARNRYCKWRTAEMSLHNPISCAQSKNISGFSPLTHTKIATRNLSKFRICLVQKSRRMRKGHSFAGPIKSWISIHDL